MPDFPSKIALSELNGTNGFRLDGVAKWDEAAYAVAGAGDVNGDGFDDIVVGAVYSGVSGAYSGQSYVVFGHAGSFDDTFSLSSIDETNGIVINGAYAGQYSGDAVAGGDVNKDGFSDLLIGAPSSGVGSTYLILGGEGVHGAIDLAAAATPEIYRFAGVLANDQSGDVLATGDINGDGFQDIVIATETADLPNKPFARNYGAVYVVFGKTGGFTPSLSSLNGHNGFAVGGTYIYDGVGRSVSTADFNGDGFDDLLFGANGVDPYGAYYVVYGKASGFVANMTIDDLDGGNGFKLISQNSLGQAISSAGDVNGDGFDDIVLSAPFSPLSAHEAGSAYVIFGHAGRSAPEVSVDALDGTNGFRVDGAAQGDLLTWAVSRAGDVNGDGFDDILLSSMYADPHGESSGSAYVVFGKASGFAASVNVSTLDGSNGFRVDGIGEGDWTGWSLSAAGDVNGDGFDDIIVGAPFYDASAEDTGAAYVIFGHASDQAVTRTGSDIAQQILGSAYADSLSGLGGADTLRGDAGADTLVGGAGVDSMMGGAGDDFFIVGNQLDVVVESAGGGFDTLASSSDYTLRHDVEIEVLRTTSSAATTPIHLVGNDFANEIFGNRGANVLDGRAGADTMTGSLGDDLYYVDDAGDRIVEGANAGSDVVAARASYTLNDGVFVELLRTVNNAGSEAIDLFGNDLANAINGNAAANHLGGAAGADLMQGLDGADTIDGGLGNDTMYGGGGVDTFVFDSAVAHNIDHIRDFAAGEKIELSNSVFSALVVGRLTSSAFHDISVSLEDSNDRILYDHSTGALFYDADGAGGAAATQIGVIDNHAALSASAFQVIA